MLVNEILELCASKYPQRPALVTDAGRMSFGELHGRVQRLSQALLERAEFGANVAILAANSAPYVEAMYAVPAAGMTLVMLNYRQHPSEWASLLADSQAKVLIVDRAFLDLLQPLIDRAPDLRHLLVIDDDGSCGEMNSYENALARVSQDAVVVQPSADATAFMIYTSGTTGFPKGVMISHNNIAAACLVHHAEFWMREGASYLQSYPLCHASGFQVFVCHVRGLCVYLPSRFDAGDWLDTIERERIAYTTIAPTMASFIMQHPRWESADLSSLVTLSYGSMPMPAEMARTFLARGIGGLVSGFGQSETTLLVTRFTAEEHRVALESSEDTLLSCGRPNMLSTIALFDDDMREVPVGEVGEMCVRGPLVMQGYWRNEEGTRAAFAGGWLHTGDLARADAEGRIYIVDRKKDMIKTGGQNVYSRELELVIVEHPGVAEVAVVGLPDPVWGENVVAAIVRHAGTDVTADEITAFFLTRLASYKKPKHIFFVDDLPKNVTGKIAKHALREKLSAQLSTLNTRRE